MFPTLILLATFLFLSASLSNAQDKPALFVFGDSVFDNGMTLYNGVRGAGADNWPYGETYFKKPAGRYSDGRLLPDFIAQYAGLPFLEPYLKPGLKDYTKGINFASAGSCVLVELRPRTVNLKMQINYFVEMVGKLKKQVGEAQANKILSEAVYMFNIGGNDWVTLLQGYAKKHRAVPNYRKRLHLSFLMGNLTAHYKTIYNQGGRKFAFLNLGPMGCLPSLKYILRFKGTCIEEPQQLARMHNVAFTTLLKRLQDELPGFKYSIYDFHTALYLRVIYGDKYGFRESQTACCGSGSYNGDFTCQKSSSSFSVCSNPNDYLWFDAAHPTDKANQALAEEFWSGGSNLVYPYNLQDLFAASNTLSDQ